MTRKALIAIIFSVLLLTACGPKNVPAAQLDLNAVVSEATGAVQIRQPGGEFAAAANGDLLQVEGQVQTGDDGRARLDLSSGTIVRVAPSSLFTLVSNAQEGESLNTNFQLDAGRIWIILSGGAAEVQTPSGVASVRGSYLMVEVLPDGQTRITCLEGTCSLENKYGEVELTDGGSAIIAGVDNAPQGGVMDVNDFQDWLDNNPEAGLIVEPTPTASSTPQPPTSTPEPTFTPTNTPLPSSGTGTVNKEVVCRAGPGMVYAKLVYLATGQSVNVTGITPDGYWLQIEKPDQPGAFCWVVAGAIDLTFSSGGLPLPPIPPTPTDVPTPTETPTPVPPPAPSIYVMVYSPAVGTPVMCPVSFYVDVQDPDGVSEVKVAYQLLDGGGNPVDSGLAYLLYDGEAYSGFVYVSYYPATLYWQIYIYDVLSNLTIYPTNPSANYVPGPCGGF